MCDTIPQVLTLRIRRPADRVGGRVAGPESRPAVLDRYVNAAGAGMAKTPACDRAYHSYLDPRPALVSGIETGGKPRRSTGSATSARQ